MNLGQNDLKLVCNRPYSTRGPANRNAGLRHGTFDSSQQHQAVPEASVPAANFDPQHFLRINP